MAAKKPVEKDPRGGLTAAGRAAFARKEGAHLKPGVQKAARDMTPEDMKRKGSWASRFYGRHPLPPLVDANGEPTRLALTAAAWGEPVPKTEAAARRIAAKGRKLLETYERLKAAKSTGGAAGAAKKTDGRTGAAKKSGGRTGGAKKSGGRTGAAKKRAASKPATRRTTAAQKAAVTASS